MALTDSLRFYAATDVGKVRDHNEDNFLVDKKLALFVVADGMGGHAAGEVASAIAVRTLHEEIKREKELLDDYASGATGASKVTPKDVVALLEHAVQRACSKIHEESRADPAKRGMGTTLSALLIAGHQGFIAHVGDSRIYLSRGGKVQQVTEDHTVYNELIKRGKLTREQIEKVQQKNAITRAVGVYERVEVDTLVIELIAGDTLMLASDGLHGYLESPDELREPLALEGDAGVKALIALANDRGGKDNITSVVVRVGEVGAVDAAQAKRFALKRDVLAHMPLFSRLSERELLRVMQAVEVRQYKDGDTVIREGDKGDELFIVLEGKVRVQRGEQVLTHLGQGEHVGEMALIRSVPRSATVVAAGPAELIAIRRADFFEILRKEHEVAVKMLWQFLGVLADRLDQTNSQLHAAKRELSAEDITADIFPAEVEDVTPPRRASTGERVRPAVMLAAAVCVSARCGLCEPGPGPGVSSAPSASAAAPAPQPPAPFAAAPGSPARAPKLACRAVAVDGDVHLDLGAPDAGPLAPVLLQGPLPAEGWVALGPHARLVAKDPRTARETTFRGAGRARACVGFSEESWVASGSFESSPGAGEAPGGEEWVVTPLAVVRYAAARLRVEVRPRDESVAVSDGVAFVWLADDAHLRTSDGGAAARGDDGWLRLEATSATLPASGDPGSLEGARAAVGRCGAVGRAAHDLTSTLLAGGADASTVASQVATRRLARAACAVAAVRQGALPTSEASAALARPLAEASEAWRTLAPP